jgi:hypothetical protein
MSRWSSERKICCGAVLAVVLLLSSGCALSHDPTRTPRTATEQLLLSHALTRSLNDLEVPLPAGKSVAVEVIGFPVDRLILQEPFTSSATLGSPDSPVVRLPASDLQVVRGMFETRLGQLGFVLPQRRHDAAFLIRLIVLTFGTEQGVSFFGMPPVQSVLLPFALPELTLFKAQRQSSYMRCVVHVYDATSGRFLRSTAWYEGTAYYNQYTWFFVFSYRTTDLPQPD